MKSSVLDHKTDEPIYLALETLLTHHFGAVLIRTPEGQPLGVLSKSDIILAYKHGISPESKIQTVMNQPLLSCLQEDDLVQALQIMVYADIKRLFVFDTSFHDIIGVISLTDIARTKSGSCKACITSRIHHACPQL
jgi:CBS domain-containing protein